MTTHSQPVNPAGRRFWIPVTATAFAWIAGIWLLEWSSPRLLASWHGFLHAGIASRFPSATFVPENPFFAGEPVAYYWFYQWVGHVISQLGRTDLLHAFRLMALASVSTLIVAAALTGRQLYRSTLAGLVIGWLALVGMNPFGPVIAATKHFVLHQDLLHYERADPGGDVFVTNEQADDRMAKPLLAAMHVGTDWQSGQDIVWFIDVSSRAPAIALLMALAWLFTHPRSRAFANVGLVATGSLLAAFNPIIGLSVAVALVPAAILCRVAGSRLGLPIVAGDPSVIRSLSFLGGALLAWPAFAHMFGVGHTVEFSFGSWMVIKAAAVIAGFVALLPLAVLGAVHAPAEGRPAVATLTLAGVLLILVVPFIELYEVNQHNFVNAASCLLAVPAAAWVVEQPSRVRRRTIAVVAGFLPTTLCLAFAFSGRGALPVAFDHTEIRRTPAGGPLDSFYRWVQSATPRDAVLIADPARPVKMSGNVSEIPALTGRTLFVDHLTYITAPYRDRELRHAIAERATGGTLLTTPDREYLRALGRPIYVVVFDADLADRVEQLARSLGPPLFRREFVAAFAPNLR